MIEFNVISMLSDNDSSSNLPYGGIPHLQERCLYFNVDSPQIYSCLRNMHEGDIILRLLEVKRIPWVTFGQEKSFERLQVSIKKVLWESCETTLSAGCSRHCFSGRSLGEMTMSLQHSRQMGTNSYTCLSICLPGHASNNMHSTLPITPTLHHHQLEYNLRIWTVVQRILPFACFLQCELENRDPEQHLHFF